MMFRTVVDHIPAVSSDPKTFPAYIEMSPVSSEILSFLNEFWEVRSLPMVAARLDISTATSFRLLKAAREQFSDPLFIKSGHAMVPTPKMEKMIGEIHDILRRMSRLGKDPKFVPKNISEEISIGCTDNALIGFLLPVVDELYQQAPDLRISIRPLTEHFQIHLAKGKLDLAFYAPANFRPAEDIRTQQLFSTKHVYVVRKGHPLEKKLKTEGKLRRSDLEPFRFIAPRYGVSQSAVSQGMTGLTANDSVALDSPYFVSSALLLLKTDFIIRLPMFTAEILTESLPLTMLPQYLILEDNWTPLLVWHKRTDTNPMLQWFRSMLTLNRKETEFTE